MNSSSQDHAPAITAVMSGQPPTPGPDYAAEAYKACLYGHADARQQMSVASALILANGIKGELLEALKLCEAWIVDLAESGDAGFWDASKAPEVIAARSAIAKAEDRQ